MTSSRSATSIAAGSDMLAILGATRSGIARRRDLTFARTRPRERRPRLDPHHRASLFGQLKFLQLCRGESVPTTAVISLAPARARLTSQHPANHLGAVEFVFPPSAAPFRRQAPGQAANI